MKLIFKVEDQPTKVLLEYLSHVYSMIDIKEIPFDFQLWADIEVSEATPISHKIVRHLNSLNCHAQAITGAQTT